MEPGNPGDYEPQTPAISNAGADYEPHLVSPDVDGSAPPPSGMPGQPQPSTDGSGEPDWSTRAQQAESRAQQAETEAGQFRAAFGELQQMAARAQLEQQQQQIRSDSQQRIEQAYAVAADMDPETALTYIRRVNDAEHQNLYRQISDTEARAQARLEATVAQIAVPQYARVRAQELGIPDNYVDELAAVPAPLIDAILPFVAKFAQQEATFKTQLAQLGRSTRAGEMASSGAFNPGGNGASPAPPSASAFDPNSPDYNARSFLTNILQRSGVLKRA
jgi:hypothetical protein